MHLEKTAAVSMLLLEKLFKINCVLVPKGICNKHCFRLCNTCLLYCNSHVYGIYLLVVLHKIEFCFKN